MKRIGKTDQGGILLEMTEDDITRFKQACNALADLLVSGANHGIEIHPEMMATEGPQAFEATLIGGTRLPDGSIKAKTFNPRKNQTAKGTVSIGGCPSKKACELCGKMFGPPLGPLGPPLGHPIWTLGTLGTPLGTRRSEWLLISATRFVMGRKEQGND